MPDSIEDQRHRKSPCIEDQEKFVSQLIGAIIDVKKIHEEHQSISHRVKRVEVVTADHEERLTSLYKSTQENASKILEELDASREFRERLEPWIATAKPYVNTIEFWSVMPLWPKRLIIFSIACTTWVIISMFNPSISADSAVKLIKAWAGL